MNAGMLVVGGVLILAIYAASLLQHGSAAVATDHLTWIVGLSILAAGAGMAGRALL